MENQKKFLEGRIDVVNTLTDRVHQIENQCE